MKYYLMALIISGVLLASCSNQNISSDKVPSVVVNTLQAKYPVTTDVDWKKDNNIYEAELDLNDSIDATVQIDEAGNLLMLKEDIAVNDLPEALMKVINKQYKDYTFDDVERLEKQGSVYYQLELNGKGKKDIALVFTAEGKEEKNITYWD